MTPRESDGTKLMLRIVIGLVALFVVERPCAAAKVTVVVPNDFENVEAPSLGGIPAGSFRFQQVFAASQFASLPQGYRTIVRFAMRPDASATGPVSVTFSDTVIRMSTTSANPGELSLVFAENVGPDERVVFEEDLVFSSANTGPPQGPRDFDLVFDLQTPFAYDPTQGNLMFDVVTAGTDMVVSQTTDFVAERGSAFEELAAFTVGAETATERWGGNIIQFTFVPEPGSLLPAWIGLFFVASRYRKLHWLAASPS